MTYTSVILHLHVHCVLCSCVARWYCQTLGLRVFPLPGQDSGAQVPHRQMCTVSKCCSGREKPGYANRSLPPSLPPSTPSLPPPLPHFMSFTSPLPLPPPSDPESGTNDKMLLLACGDGYMRIYDIRSRNRVSSSAHVILNASKQSPTTNTQWKKIIK